MCSGGVQQHSNSESGFREWKDDSDRQLYAKFLVATVMSRELPRGSDYD